MSNSLPESTSVPTSPSAPRPFAPCTACGNPSFPSRQEGLSWQTLSQLHYFLEQRLGEPIFLSHMAQVSGYSSSRFRLLFRQSTGMTPHQFLIHMRLHRACQLLAASSRPVRQIAADCGFCDPSYLARVMSHHLGCTPRQYRLAHQTPGNDCE